ncbi:hypothetical protein Tco_0545060 [Tanacetum coccineum]
MTDFDDMEDMEMIMQQLQYEQEQEVESSHRHNYIYREREEAKERLMAYYFGAHPKYPSYYFRKRYRMSRKLFLEIVAGIEIYIQTVDPLPSHFDFFRVQLDATGLPERLVVEDPQTDKEAWDLIAKIFNDNKRSRTIALKAELRISNKYDNVSGIIVHREPFPDLKTARSMLTTEEMRLKSKSQASHVDSSSSSPIVAPLFLKLSLRGHVLTLLKAPFNLVILVSLFTMIPCMQSLVTPHFGPRHLPTVAVLILRALILKNYWHNYSLS